MTEQEVNRVKNTCDSVLLFHVEAIKSRDFYNSVLRLIYDRIDHNKKIVEQKQEIDRLNELLKEKQPKKGHWTPYDRYGVNDARDYECSVCKRVFSWNTDFCPMCGADMREGGDGE